MAVRCPTGKWESTNQWVTCWVDMCWKHKRKLESWIEIKKKMCSSWVKRGDNDSAKLESGGVTSPLGGSIETMWSKSPNDWTEMEPLLHYLFFLSHSQSFTHPHRHKLKSIQSRTVPLSFSPLWGKTVPGMNWSTSVFSVPKLNLMCLFIVTKLHQTDKQPFKCVIHSEDIFCHTSENNQVNYRRFALIL